MLKRSVLIFDLEVKSLGRPLYRSLATAIADLIDSGDIEPGEFLPSRKDLAKRLGISIQTVREAYEDLDARGYLSGEVGRGTRVMGRPEGVEWKTIVQDANDTITDLSILRPVFGAKHAAALEAALGDTLKTRDFSMFATYRPSSGLKPHRTSLGKWLAQFDVRANPDELLITSGGTHASFLALSSICEANDTVLTTALTDVGIIGICRSLGLNLHALPFDRQGLASSELERACETLRPRALILTATLGNPYPYIIPEQRRLEIVEIAKRHRLILIEDDCFRPLLKEAPPAFKSLLPGQTIYLTTFSKVLMSGIRVGCVVPPPALYSRMAARLRSTTWMTAPFLADLVARWIEDGAAIGLVEWQREELMHRQAIVRECLPSELIVAEPTGLSSWLTLPSGWRTSDFVAAAAQSGIAVTSPDAFRIGDTRNPDGVRICVGSARTADDLRAAMQRLSGIISHPSDFMLDYA